MVVTRNADVRLNARAFGAKLEENVRLAQGSHRGDLGNALHKERSPDMSLQQRGLEYDPARR